MPGPEKIRYGIIGTGMMGHEHMRAAGVCRERVAPTNLALMNGRLPPVWQPSVPRTGRFSEIGGHGVGSPLGRL